MPERGNLTIIVCGAGPAGDVDQLVALAHDQGWTVRVVATPSALWFIDVDALEELTGQPVRSAHRNPADGHTRSSGNPDAIIVAPATYNTINKWALGIADTYALDLLAEALGLSYPIVVLPFVNAGLAAHFAYERNTRDLIAAGATFVDREPHQPGTGGLEIPAFPWAAALDLANRALALDP